MFIFLKILLFISISFTSFSAENKKVIKMSAINLKDAKSITHAINVMTQVYESLGYKVNLIRQPVARGIRELKIGLNDAEACRYGKFDNWNETVLKVEPFLNKTDITFYYIDNKYDLIKKKKQLETLRVGVLAKSGYGKELSKMIKVKDISKKVSLVKMLKAGRLDFIAFPTYDFNNDKEKLKALKLQDIEIVYKCYHYVHKKLESEIPKISSEIKNILLKEKTN